MSKTIDGDVKFNIKPGTQTGTRIRLKERAFAMYTIRIQRETSIQLLW